MSEHLKAHLQPHCGDCGEPWPCATTRAHRRRLRASSAHMQDQPIIEGSYLPPSVLLGAGWPDDDPAVVLPGQHGTEERP